MDFWAAKRSFPGCIYYTAPLAPLFASLLASICSTEQKEISLMSYDASDR